MYTWSARGGRSYNLDNRKKPISEPSESESDKNKEENDKIDTTLAPPPSSNSSSSLETTDTKVENVDN